LSDEPDMLAAWQPSHRFGTQAMLGVHSWPLKHQKLLLSFSSDFVKEPKRETLKGSISSLLNKKIALLEERERDLTLFLCFGPPKRITVSAFLFWHSMLLVYFSFINVFFSI